jgi:hypothetical protein
LTSFVQSFLDAYRRMHENHWACCDIALAVLRELGARGIEEIAAAAGLSTGHVYQLAQVAACFPPHERARIPDPPPSFSHLVYAARAKRLFPEGTPEHDPVWWLEQAVQNRWSTQALRTVMRERAKPGAPSPELGRAARALILCKQAEDRVERIRQEIESFNEAFAAFYGATLELVERPVETALRKIS